MPCGCGKKTIHSNVSKSTTVSNPSSMRPIALNQSQILENIKKDVENIRKKHLK